MRSPKRKLLYFTNKKSPPEQSAGMVDVDKIFDDFSELEQSLDDESDELDSSPLLHMSDTETNLIERDSPPGPQEEGQLTEELPISEMIPERDTLNPVMRPTRHDLDMGVRHLKSLFKAKGTVKTSSSIEAEKAVESVEELSDEFNTVCSPILFTFEDDGEEETDGSVMESPPGKIVLIQNKNKGAASCQTTTEASVSAVSHKPHVAAPVKKSGNAQRNSVAAMSRRGEKDTLTYLKKLREASQPKPSCSRKSLSTVKELSPSEPEDEFKILEDDEALWISIPHKAATRTRKSRTPCNDKDSLRENGKKDGPLETVNEEQQSDQAQSKLRNQTDLRKNTKSSKAGNKNVKTNVTLKGAHNATQRSCRLKEKVYDDAAMGQSQEHSDAEDSQLCTDMGITKAQMDKKDKQAAPVESEGRSTGDVELIAKRKRRPPGEWWIYSSQGSEETKDTEEQPQSKKSKQNNRKPPAAAPSPVQTKKQRVLKKMNQAEPIASSSQSTNNNKSKKEKKVKRTKQPNDRNNRRDNVKASKALDAVEEQIELQEQQQLMDKDLDPLQSSPLLLTHRDQSLDSGEKILPKVYHPIISAVASPRGGAKSHIAVKTRRKQSSNQWMIKNVSEDVNSIPSQPQQQNLRPQKQKEKQLKQIKSPGLRIPKTGNLTVLSKPLGGAIVSPLTQKPMAARKTVKHYLATFKEIVTSPTKTPMGVSRRESGLNMINRIAVRPEVEVCTTESASCSEPEARPTLNVGESSNSLVHAQSSSYHSEKMLRALRSGPSSKIGPDWYEDDDNLEQSSDELASSPLLHMSDTETNLIERDSPPAPQEEVQLTEELPISEMIPERDTLNPVMRPTRHDLDMGVRHLKSLFKAKGTVKTSSPIEAEKAVESVEELSNKLDGAISPIHCARDEDGEEESVTEHLSRQKCNGTDGSVMESPPGKIVLIQNKNKGAASCQTTTEASVSAVSHKPHVAAPVKKSGNAQRNSVAAMSRRGEKDTLTYLKKLREASQPKPSCSRKSLSTVKELSPSEPEDEFKILEDDEALWISIPHKAATRTRKSRTPCNDKDSLRENGKKDGPLETVNEEQQSDQAQSKLRNQTDLRKNTKSSKAGNKNAKTNVTLKGAHNATQRSCRLKEKVYDDAAVGQSQEHSDAEDSQLCTDMRITKAQMDKKDKQAAPVESEGRSTGVVELIAKRKRRPPGEWWIYSGQGSEETKDTEEQPQSKKSKQNNRKPPAAAPSPVQTKKQRVLKKMNQAEPIASSSQSTNNNKSKKEKKVKRTKQPNDRNNRRDNVKASKALDAVEEQIELQEQQQLMDKDLDPLQSSPLLLTHRDQSLDSGEKILPKVYHPIISAVASPRGGAKSHIAVKTRRKQSSNQWMIKNVSEDVNSIPSQPQQQNLRPQKQKEKQLKQIKSPGLGIPKTGNLTFLSKPLGGAIVSPLTQKPMVARKTVKQSNSQEIVTSPTKTPMGVRGRESGLNMINRIAARPEVEVCTTESASCSEPEARPTLNVGESSNSLVSAQSSSYHSEEMLRALRSGPSSKIGPDWYEDDDNLALPSNRVNKRIHCVLDLCAPPLKPLILQPMDKANITKWCQNFWSIASNVVPEISSDHFNWYSYKDRALGIKGDLNYDYFCSGKMLLDSHTEKPLWIDHIATTVFNLVTSSVIVTIDTSEFRISPSDSFMAPCGHAYSIQNTTDQPAVLCFTRIYVENSR